MRRLIPALGVRALLVAPSPVAAITNGSLDGGGHPNVGGLVSPKQFSDDTWTYCSGTLISPTLFLTAAHCAAADGEQAIVTFSTTYRAGDATYTGTFHVDPLYPGPENDPHDIAVVVVEQPVPGITPARLPAAGSLSDLPTTSSSPPSATARTR